MGFRINDWKFYNKNVFLFQKLIYHDYIILIIKYSHQNRVLYVYLQLTLIKNIYWIKVLNLWSKSWQIRKMYWNKVPYRILHSRHFLNDKICGKKRTTSTLTMLLLFYVSAKQFKFVKWKSIVLFRFFVCFSIVFKGFD